MEKNSVTGGRNIMATEAQNIMQAFYSAQKRDEVQEEEREFKKGALGYMGGIPGAMFDIAAGMEAYKTSQALTEGVKELTDTRSPEQKVIDGLIEADDLDTKVRSEFKRLADTDPKYKKAYDKYLNTKLEDQSLEQIATMLSGDLEGVIANLNLTDRVNAITQGVQLTNISPDGTQVNYTVGKFQPGQGMLKRFGQ
jgi:hypothetical protein